MNEYVGMVCPFCNEEIQENDAVVVCPECQIPHHRACWQQNQGCTTFGCSQQNVAASQVQPAAVVQSVPVEAPAAPQPAPTQAICTACGAVLPQGQAFCSQCGTPVGAPQKKRCTSCGNELQEGQAFCGNCGQRVGAEVPPAVNPAIQQFNAAVAPAKKKRKKGPAIIAIILAICVVLGIFVSNSIKAEKAAQAKAEFLSDAQTFLDFSLDAGSNVEDVVDQIQKCWYDSIWNDKYGSDINKAISYAMNLMSAEINQAEVDYNKMSNLYNKLKNVPSDVADEDRAQLQQISNAVRALFSVYEEFYEMAVDPSGSYNSYSAANGEVTDEFLDCYEDLEDLLD